MQQRRDWWASFQPSGERTKQKALPPRAVPRQLGPSLSVCVDPGAPGSNLHGHRLRGQPLGPDLGEPPG